MMTDALMTRSAVGDLVISQADLFHVPGVPLAEYRNACWFADVWAEHCHPGMHLRSIFYKLVSVGGVLMAAGVRPHEGRGRPPADPVLDSICLPFENNGFCWGWLQKAAIQARYWQVVDARSFEEHRSPKARVNSEARDLPTPAVALPDEWPERGFPQPTISGYDYMPADQPLTVEVWCEKSTMDAILAPLCRDLRVNYQPLTGFFSVTRAVEMLCRLKKPAAVVYISDLDGAGCNMPTAFAEALAHYAPIYAPGVDIKLKQIVLTEQQVLDYHLPRNVIDKQDESPYNKRFRTDHPLGPCELDALEAIRPGELARLVRKAVAPYFDTTLYGRLGHAHAEAQQIVNTAWGEQTANAADIMSAIQDDIDDVCQSRDDEFRPYYATITAIRARYDGQLAPLYEERDHARQAILDTTIDVDLPARPQPSLQVVDDVWLYSRQGTR